MSHLSIDGRRVRVGDVVEEVYQISICLPHINIITRMTVERIRDGALFGRTPDGGTTSFVGNSIEFPAELRWPTTGEGQGSV